VILKSKSRPKLAEAIADDTHTDLSIRNGFPTLGRFRSGFFDIFETLNDFPVFVDDLFRSVCDAMRRQRCSA
jgi:hypothetical protein